MVVLSPYFHQQLQCLSYLICSSCCSGWRWRIYIALFVVSLYQLAQTNNDLVLVKKQGIKAFSIEELEPLSSSFKRGWTSGLLYIGAIIPLAITIGPLGEN